MTDGDDEGFIGLPPGMTAPVDSTSGTIKRDRPERPRSDRDEVVFFPVVPGAPPGAAAPTAGQSASTPTIDDATSISASRHTAHGWRLVIEGREPVAVEGPLYLGRHPVAAADHPQARVLAVEDAAKSVSKTHALLEVDADGLWVHDLDSTNGVWVVPAGEDATEVTPGQRVAVPAGADLELGDLVIQVEHN
ncbi:FHA domain-containing protein [Aeromicrobium sp.]|uniref:FHA domain-containing protein n=1 Tax=Aeromicrobium sp. TaxID=1871063 RepID=UPI0019ACA094|nr:FHA domain-containing protein [Aeromicrobium sp.]MBC7631902.1 FHA domain-containing protein [Aeromicrobium sp.]